MTVEQKPVKLDRLVEILKEQDDEIERLREALRQCYVLFNDARNGPPNLFKICCEGMRVVRAENVLGRGNG